MPLLRRPQFVEQAAEAPPSNPPARAMKMPVPVKAVLLRCAARPRFAPTCRHRQRRW
jgi:hypothetical protein